MRGLIRGGVLAALAIAGPAAAKAGDKEAQAADAQCLAFTSLLADQPDENMQRGGTMGALYFLGKMTARDPDMDLAALLDQASKDYKTGDQTAIAKRCGFEFRERSGQLRTAGAALKDRASGQAQSKPD